jgi:hypothetical protein
MQLQHVVGKQNIRQQLAASRRRPKASASIRQQEAWQPWPCTKGSSNMGEISGDIHDDITVWTVFGHYMCLHHPWARCIPHSAMSIGVEFFLLIPNVGVMYFCCLDRTFVLPIKPVIGSAPLI